MILHRESECGVYTGGRHGRFTLQEGCWFIHTREGWELGPHTNRSDAADSLNDYLVFIQHADAKTLQHFYKTCLAGRILH